MKTRASILILFCLCMGGSAFALKDEEAVRAYQERINPERARFALNEFRDLFKEKPQESERSWHLAMACYFVGLRLTSSEEEQQVLFNEGKAAALEGLKSKPDCAECHFWAAINMALYGQSVGVLKTLSSLSTIREHLESSIELNPKVAGAGALRLLGKIEEALPGILGGSNKRAIQFYGRAIETSPDEPLNYLFLSRLMRDEGKDVKEVRRIVERGALIETLGAERVESLEARSELRRQINGEDGEGR